jgi:hypothetical protein
MAASARCAASAGGTLGAGVVAGSLGGGLVGWAGEDGGGVAGEVAGVPIGRAAPEPHAVASTVRPTTATRRVA